MNRHLFLPIALLIAFFVGFYYEITIRGFLREVFDIRGFFRFYVTNVFIGILFGFMFWMFKGKRWHLVVLTISFISFYFLSGHLHFTSMKQDFLTGTSQYPDFIPKSERITNYQNYFDFIKGDTHYKFADRIRDLIKKIIIWIGFTIATYYLIDKLIARKKVMPNDTDLIDQ